MYICICNNINSQEIKDVISLGENNRDSIKECLGIGSCCGNCNQFADKYIGELIQEIHSPVNI